MNDTSPRAEKLFRELMMKRSPEERVRMASSMFDAARLIMTERLITETPGLEDNALRRALFLRTYGPDLSPRMIERVLARMTD